jgi:hypothetical protein
MFNFKKKEENIPKDVQGLIEEVKKLRKENTETKKELQEIKKQQQFYLQNVGMIRFNPFSAEGGNQSFSTALLDEKGNGIVITNLYTKEGNRTYGKPIKGGKSEYSLSEEEERVIAMTLKTKE